MVGRILFARNCVTCHGDRGVGAVENPGSDDGTVPPLNPIDPVFIDSANGDPGTFTRAIDLFVQHGSRPSGEKPQLSMVGWGDHKLLSQQDLADIEAYVMQLNGLYWSGHWAPPAEVQMTASRADGAVSYMTYRMTLINHGTGTLSNLTLHDQCRAGLAVVSAYAGAPGLNPAKVTGNLVEWSNVGIPDGGALGPFVIVAQIQDAHVTVEPNVSSLQFTWSTWDGQKLPSNVVSNAPPPAPAPGQHPDDRRPGVGRDSADRSAVPGGAVVDLQPAHTHGQSRRHYFLDEHRRTGPHCYRRRRLVRLGTTQYWRELESHVQYSWYIRLPLHTAPPG